MRIGLVFSAVILLFLGVRFPVCASRLPASPAAPSGCASGGFDVAIEPSREWGVVPFTCAFTLEVAGESDSIEAVHWSFGAEDPLAALGTHCSHTFTEPVDYEVTARVTTSLHGTVIRRVTVSGYGAVMTLTFDDGHKTVLTEAMPLLASYGVTGTAYIVPAWTGLSPDDYMTWEDIALLQDAGWDIGSHSMTHPKLTQVDPFDLVYEVRQSQVELRSRGFPARSFSLPHEAYNQAVLDVVKQYYESCKTDRGINPGFNDTNPHMIKSQTSHSWLPFDFYRAHIDSVLETGGWYVLNNHILTGDCNGTSWCVPAVRIAQVIEYAQANRVKVANMEEVMRNRIHGHSLDEEGLEAGVPPEPGIEAPGVPLLLVHSPADIEFSVTAPGRVGVSVYDVVGRRVKPLLEAHLGAGRHSVAWDGTNGSGEGVASGYYFVVFTRDGALEAAARVVVLR